MKNLRARRFSNRPMSGDLSASISFAGTLWTYCNGSYTTREDWDNIYTSMSENNSEVRKVGENFTFPLL